ncbi:MAG: signal peptidase I [Lachnospiraceae bacterium]|nr:signal peptidase I [Lachnospiraceae bacterium]
METEILKEENNELTEEKADNTEKTENTGNIENTGKNENPDNTAISETEQEKPAEGEKFDWKKELRDWLIIFVSAFALAYAITHFVIIKTEIISGSMISTLNIDDHVVANRLSYVFSEPKRGDIIFFAYPDDESKTYVKRIIGLPGEKVEIKKGKIYINDSDTPLDEPYLHEKPVKSDWGPYQVPEASFFMLGDNRNVSIDSRYWDNKFVRKDQIFGKAWFRYRPGLSLIKGADYE